MRCDPLCLIVPKLSGVWRLVHSVALVVEELGDVHLSGYELNVIVEVLHGANHVVAHLAEGTVMTEGPAHKHWQLLTLSNVSPGPLSGTGPKVPQTPFSHIPSAGGGTSEERVLATSGPCHCQ